jgi:hypothetical protein
MAFIRWKTNSSGKRQAYLVHAYRGPDGKPKQKVLAYLGDKAELSPEHHATLRQKHPDLEINWEKIKPASRPATNVAALSDAELLREIRHLRHERGVSQRHFPQFLREHGLPRCSGQEANGFYPDGRTYGVLERALERGEPQNFYLNPELEIAPALRKAFSKTRNA